MTVFYAGLYNYKKAMIGKNWEDKTQFSTNFHFELSIILFLKSQNPKQCLSLNHSEIFVT